MPIQIQVKCIPEDVMIEIRKHQNRIKEEKNVGKFSLSATVLVALKKFYLKKKDDK